MSRYTLTIDIPDRTPDRVRVEPAMRLKQWLKLGLRGFGIRAVTIDPVPPPPFPSDAPTPQTHAGRPGGGDGPGVGSGADRAAALQPEALAGQSINQAGFEARAEECSSRPLPVSHAGVSGGPYHPPNGSCKCRPPLKRVRDGQCSDKNCSRISS